MWRIGEAAGSAEEHLVLAEGQLVDVAHDELVRTDKPMFP